MVQISSRRLLLTLLAFPSVVDAQQFVWWEAEKPVTTNFPARHAFQPANETERSVLSGGAWLGADRDGAKPFFATYTVDVPSEGTWHLYARKFWKHGPFKWTLGSGTDQIEGVITRDVALMDDAPLRQHVVANWVSLGEVKLKPGPTPFRVESSELKGPIVFDCFLLTRTPFTPRGKMKPGEKWGRADDGFFPFEPDEDPYNPSPISMRHLNEAHAGENGRILARGSEFVHEKTGEPVRFWAVNTGTDTLRKDRASIDEQARFWAKHGVNMVRVHGGFWKKDDFTQPDETLIDALHYYVAAMKREGIYVHLSSYFPLWLDFNEKTPGFPGYGGNAKHPFALQFFNGDFQKIQQGWFRSILSKPNPHANGTPLAADPALAMVEILNEDSFFFWTFKPYENVPAPQMAILEKQFGDWLAKKHGSVRAALDAWKGATVKGDDAAAGRVGFLPLWNMVNQPGPRANATAEFLARRQNEYFTEMRRFLKEDLKYRGLVSASNWTVADARKLMPLEKWSNKLDFLDRHGYWAGPHDGPRSGYSLSQGDTFEDRSSLVGPISTPLYETQWLGVPSTLSEINWTPPNRYRAEYPVLAAAYGSLQGNDAWFHFATGTSSWESANGKFSVATPVVMGQFPATSLIYRKRLIKEADPALSINLKLADLFALKGGPVATEVNLDKLRFSDAPAPTSSDAAINPLTFLVGKVTTDITDAGAPTRGVDLSQYVDAGKKTARSLTGELAWDFGNGVVTLDAPGVSGAVGFLSKAGKISLKSLTLTTPLEYASVLLVALDDKPLASSARMLLQVMTEEKQFGFQAPGSPKRTIASLGTAPLTLRTVAGQISLKRTDLKITPLDFNGYPTAPATPLPTEFNLDPTTLYYLLEK